LRRTRAAPATGIARRAEARHAARHFCRSPHPAEGAFIRFRGGAAYWISRLAYVDWRATCCTLRYARQRDAQLSLDPVPDFIWSAGGNAAALCVDLSIALRRFRVGHSRGPRLWLAGNFDTQHRCARRTDGGSRWICRADSFARRHGRENGIAARRARTT